MSMRIIACKWVIYIKFDFDTTVCHCTQQIHRFRWITLSVVTALDQGFKRRPTSEQSKKFTSSWSFEEWVFCDNLMLLTITFYDSHQTWLMQMRKVSVVTAARNTKGQNWRQKVASLNIFAKMSAALRREWNSKNIIWGAFTLKCDRA